MAHEFYARRKLGSIVPIDVHAEEILRDIPSSDILKVKVTRPRNHKHSRKFHALLGVIFPHQDTYQRLRRSGRLCMRVLAMPM